MQLSEKNCRINIYVNKSRQSNEGKNLIIMTKNIRH